MNKMVRANSQALTPTLDIDKLVSDWLEYERKSNGASENTVNAYRRAFGIYRQSVDVAAALPVDVVDYKSELSARYSAQTVNLYLTAVRGFYRYCVNAGLTFLNPASNIKGVKRSKSKVHKRDSLTNGEVVSVLHQPDISTLAGLRDKAILTLLAYCAIRSVEIYRADVASLRTRGDRLTLDVQGKGRTSSDEYVIIPLSQEPVIRAYLVERAKLGNTGALFVSLSNRTYGQRLSLRAIRQVVKGYYASAGVVGDKKSTHSLRHSAITNAIRKGAAPMDVQAMARHASLDTTLGYYHQVSRLDKPAEDIIDYGE